MPAAEKVWDELLLELKAAGDELYAAFAGAAGRAESRETASIAEARRYDEALRRFDAINAKIKALGSKVRREKMRLEAR